MLDRPPFVAPNRRTYAWLTAWFAAFAVYGSLVPFSFRPLPIAAALAWFANVPYLELGIGSRADYVANILLFVPLAFCLTGALRADRHGRLGALAAGLVVLISGVTLSVTIEFTQIFFPPRTVSINDIAAETIGTLVGCLAWHSIGDALTAWLRELSAERGQADKVVRALFAYAAAFTFTQLLPLDIIYRPGELAQKIAEGRLVWLPFSATHASAFQAIWSYGTDVVLAAPIGALAALAWTRHDYRRRTVVAVALGAAAVAAIELAQILIFTRYTDVTDLITGTAGVGLGVAAVARWSDRSSERAPISRSAPIRPLAALCTVAWVATVLAYHWYPFDFLLERDFVRERLPLLWVAPFRSYYFGSEFHAFTEISRKFVLALVLGGAAHRAWPLSVRAPLARLQVTATLLASAAFFTGIEIGQVLLPGHVPDFTDALIGVAGVAAGIAVVRWLAHRPEAGSRPLANTWPAARVE